MNPNSKEVISTPDGICVDMGRWNTPEVRQWVEEVTDPNTIENYMKIGGGKSYDEAVTLQLHHIFRVIDRDYRDGKGEGVWSTRLKDAGFTYERA